MVFWYILGLEFGGKTLYVGRAQKKAERQQELKKKFRDNLGVSFVSPTTGKKRVQCNVCMKTFCDKGALKIHFKPVKYFY